MEHSSKDTSKNADRFGHVDPQHNFFDLETQADRSRGFFTRSDREYLLNRHLEDNSERHARQRIRERSLNAFFDLRYLRYVPKRDKRQIFTKAQEDDDLHLLNAVKEFVKFQYRGLAEAGVDVASLLEKALYEAERERAVARGQVVDLDVEISIDAEPAVEATELHDRLREGESLTRDELAALVNNQYITVDLADALYHQARDLWANPDPEGATGRHRYSWEDPDEERAEEVVRELRRLFHDRGIETLSDFETAWCRYAGEEKIHADQLHDLVTELERTAPHYVTQMASETDLKENDMELLHDIIWNPGNESLEELIRPPAAGEDWNPAEDATLQKFVARVEVALESGAIMHSWADEHRQRWHEFLEMVEFDAKEWEIYMREQRIGRVREELEHVLERANDPTPDAVQGVESYGELLERLNEQTGDAPDFDAVAASYTEEIAVEAARRLAASEEEE